MSPTTRPEPSRRHRTQPTGPADPPGAGSPGRSRRSRRARTGSQEHDEAGLSAQEHQALRSAGLAVGTPLARRLGPGAPLRALDAQGRHVVVRILEIPESEAGAAMLRRIAGMRALRHPALVPIREVICLPQGRAAVVMDLIEGASLDVVLGARGRLPSGQLATLLDALGSGLAHMHERGSIHGDVSSGNVVIDVSGQPVLIDLLGSVMETGTTSCAAPERLAGGPATPASDVYALAALLRECAGSSAAARRLERLIGDAMSERADQRPSARDLAARAPELAQPSPIVLPDGARLAAGSLRAAARTPTRMVEPRSRLARSGLPRADRPRMGRARPRRHLAVVTCAALALIGGAMLWNPGDILGQVLPAWAATAHTGANRPTASAFSASPSSSVSSAPSPPVPGSPAPSAGPSAAPSPQGSPGTGQDQEDLVTIVTTLARARDEALMAGDPQALATITVPDSPAATADAAILEELAATGERIEGLETSVSQIVEVPLPPQAGAWPNARAVRLTLSQGASSRVGPQGTRTVPVLQARQVVLILVPGPWRVAEVLAVD